MIDTTILLTGMIVLVARIVDVAIGTIRTIVTVQGRTVIAFCLGFVEISIWVTIASTVINQIHEYPLLVAFYATGYATGNVVGILVERKLAFGIVILRVISIKASQAIANSLREKGQPVTIFMGEGMTGPVAELYIATRRRDISWILPMVTSLDPKAFYVLEVARDVNRILKPTYSSMGGWRAVAKRK
ncbi:MAG: DUF2179 domain-containing protein [Desulfobacteraceae bacterium]|nr:DUF2179 domain-containing protein [Desulfobacteraceae bacterium]